MNEFIKGMYQKTNFAKRLVAVLLAVVTMGFALSWLVLVNLGTDPCTSMNLAVSRRLDMTLGNWQALLNCILFIVVIIYGKEKIGFGTLANMFLVGYSLDFFSWLWSRVLPAGLFDSMVVRIVVLFPALAIFILAAAVYMDVELGTAPYDAIPFIVFQHQKRFSFRMICCFYDFFIIILALIFGAKIGIVTILMAFTLGPVIAYVGKKMGHLLGMEERKKNE